jgi:hypothetical protein
LASDQARLVRARVELDSELLGETHLLFMDPEMALINGTTFDSGKAVALKMGFGSGAEDVFSGEVVRLEHGDLGKISVDAPKLDGRQVRLLVERFDDGDWATAWSRSRTARPRRSRGSPARPAAAASCCPISLTGGTGDDTVSTAAGTIGN